MGTISKKAVRPFLACLLIAIAGAIAYSNSLTGGFIWDDEYLIEKNVYIKSPSSENAAKIFTEDFGAGGGKHYGFYRPLQVLSYAGDYALWELDVRGYHAVNLSLHLLTAITVFWFVSVLYGDLTLAFLAAFLFVLHPVHTEAVDYISGRGDPMAVPLTLSAFVLYIKSADRFDLKYWVPMCGLFLASLFVKEGSLILPALILVYHFAFSRKVNMINFASLVMIVGLYFVFRAAHVPGVKVDPGGLGEILERAPGFFAAVPAYAGLLVAPGNLHMEYGEGPFKLTDPAVILGIAMAAALISAAFFLRGRSRYVTFSVLWSFAALIPVSNLYPVAFYMAEHYLYLPSVGFFILFAAALEKVWRNEKIKYLAAVIFVLASAYYAARTFAQGDYWKDNIGFYERTVKCAPTYRMLNDLGRLYERTGRDDDAIAMYERAITMKPSYALPYNNIGVIFNDRKQYGRALPYFGKALELDPGYADAWNNIAVAYSAVGRNEDAVKAYGKAIEYLPGFGGAYCNLGSLYGKLGKKEEAIAYYKKAIEVDPYLDNAYYNLALTYYRGRDAVKAREVLEAAIKVNPRHGPSHALLAAIYFGAGKYEIAIAHCDEALGAGVGVSPRLMEALKPYRRSAAGK
jgi:tetratricopeptide (TPR) repeat protein